LGSLTFVSIVVMGVQGIGKSTIGSLLASELGVPFIDGDRLHPARNIKIMASGKPLNDSDRAPWLSIVGETLAGHQASGGAVIACSALRRAYRDFLRASAPDAYFVEPFGPVALVSQRIAKRDHEYMPHALLQSQYGTLEPLQSDEKGLRTSVVLTPDAIVEQVISSYRAQMEQPA